MNRITEQLAGADRLPTPWGLPTTRTTYAEGIIFYTGETNHGGFWLSIDRIAELPPELRSLGTWCGQPWYEEDCDANLIALAFPKFFTDAEIFNAYEAMKRPPSYLAGVDLWLGSPAMAPVRIIVDAFFQQHRGDFRFAGAIADGNGWRIRAITLDRKQAVIFSSKTYPELGDVFTLQQIKDAGCDIIQAVEQPAA